MGTYWRNDSLYCRVEESRDSKWLNFSKKNTQKFAQRQTNLGIRQQQETGCWCYSRTLLSIPFTEQLIMRPPMKDRADANAAYVIFLKDGREASL